MCVYIYVYTYTCIYTCISTNIYMYVSVYIYTNVQICTCIQYIYVFLYVYMYRKCIYTNIRRTKCTHTYINMYIYFFLTQETHSCGKTGWMQFVELHTMHSSFQHFWAYCQKDRSLSQPSRPTTATGALRMCRLCTAIGGWECFVCVDLTRTYRRQQKL